MVNRHSEITLVIWWFGVGVGRGQYSIMSNVKTMLDWSYNSIWCLLETANWTLPGCSMTLTDTRKGWIHLWNISSSLYKCGRQILYATLNCYSPFGNTIYLDLSWAIWGPLKPASTCDFWTRLWSLFSGERISIKIFSLL